MTVQNDNLTWFLAQLKPNSVKIAERNLHRQGFQTFLPIEEITKRSRSKFVTIKQPMFPGYIFVAFDVAKGGWQKINSTSGITRLVSFNKGPAPVPQEIVTALMRRGSAEGEAPTETLLEGDQVSVTQGPFTDFLAEVEKVEPNRRVWLLLDIMGGKTRVAVPTEQLRKVK